MPPPRSISVLMPTFQGATFLGRVLESLGRQQVDVPWDFLAIDSGSTDGTLALLEGWRERLGVPFELRRIHPVEFDHGDTRNLLAAESAGELLVFLTQDAIPVGSDWLARLAANFADEQVGAAYCRNVPRADAQLLTKVFSAGDPGYAEERREVRLPADYEQLDAHARRLLYNFNDVASAVRRALWERHPFPRTWFGEDLLMSRALLEAGYTVVYEAEALVEHSHDYDPGEMRRRAEIDGRFNAEWLDRVCVGSEADAEVLVEGQLERDRAALEEAGASGAELERELARARELRRAAFLGLWEGGRTERRRPPTALLAEGSLHVLYVVHGFPPDTWAGTEVYTLELARELQRRGHRVTVLTRAPLRPGAHEYSLSEERIEGLDVLRMARGLEGRRVRESYVDGRAEGVFRDVLARLAPDVVHFQHLLHFSCELPRVARAAGVPTLITCNDYWALCARVQLIRPDGVRCEDNQGLGCIPCVKGRDLERVERARRWYPAALPLVRAMGRTRKRWRAWARVWEDVAARQETVLRGFAAADLLVAPSRFMREKLLASGAFEEHRCVYSDYGVRGPEPDASSAAVSAAAGPLLRVGYVGSLVRYKGVDVLVRAMAELDPARAALEVHGDFRPEEDEYHAELAGLAGSNVQFRGRFDNARVAEVYAGIDVLVVPSMWFENSPITIHEAFLHRTPVVVSDIGGMAELVPDGLAGLQFRVGDPGDLARVLGGLVREPARVTALSEAAPRVKSIVENGREMEFRYRALACLRPVVA